MAFTIISAKDFVVKLKATIHYTGKLGFTEITAEHLKLNSSSGIKIARDDTDTNLLYLINCRTPDEDTFKVSSAGDYFYVNTKPLFDTLGYDYKRNNIMFDMVRARELETGDVEIYKLIKRIKPRKQKAE